MTGKIYLGEHVKISIIMAVYNSSKYLEKSINSVLSQTFMDYELILIDDDSTDNSWEICQQYAKSDNRIRAIHQKNQGVSEVRNYGLLQCSGEYVRFMDADDVIQGNSLESLLEPMMTNEENDLIIGSYDSNDSSIYKGTDMIGLHSKEEFVEHFVKYAPSFYYGVTWNKLYRMDIIKKYKIRFEHNLHWSEDLLFNLEYFQYCTNIYYVNKSVYFYVRRNNTLSTVSNRYSDSESFKIELKRFEAIHKFVHTVHCTEKIENESYNFLFTKLNERLNQVLKEPEMTHYEKYGKFVKILEFEKVQQYIRSYNYKNPYILNRIMVKLIQKKCNKLLFIMYYLKYIFKRNPYIQRRLIQISLLPKYPL